MRKLNDLDLRRLKNEWPEIESDLWTRADTVLHCFAHSTNYQVLKSLRLDSFVAEKDLADSSLASFSLGELLKRWPDVFFETNHLTADFLLRIITLFENLFGTDEVDTSRKQVGPCELQPSKLSTFSGFRVPRYIPNLDDQQRLSRAVEALQASDQFNSLVVVKIGRYWPEDYVKAPFLEELSFGQLASLSLDHVIEQRSFTKEKLEALIVAIDAAVQGFTGERKSIDSSASIDKTDSDYLLHNMVAAYWPQTTVHSEYQLYALVNELVKDFTDDELLLFWFLDSFSDQVICDLVVAKDLILEKARVSVADRVIELFQHKAPKIYQHWRDVLATTACLKKDLTSCYYIESVNHQFHESLCSRLLYFMGAKELSYQDKILSGYISTNLSLFSSLVELAFNKLPCSRNDFDDLIEQFFPHVKSSDLLEFFANWISITQEVRLKDFDQLKLGE